jgi:hypothetical protein
MEGERSSKERVSPPDFQGGGGGEGRVTRGGNDDGNVKSEKESEPSDMGNKEVKDNDDDDGGGCGGGGGGGGRVMGLHNMQLSFSSSRRFLGLEKEDEVIIRGWQRLVELSNVNPHALIVFLIHECSNNDETVNLFSGSYTNKINIIFLRKPYSACHTQSSSNRHCIDHRRWP